MLGAMVAPSSPARRSLFARILGRGAPAEPVALAKGPTVKPPKHTRPIGHDGMQRSGGYFRDDASEHNADLDMGAWRGTASTVGAGRRIAKEDDDVRGIVYSYTHALMGTSWDVAPAGENSADAVMLARAFELLLMGRRKRLWGKRLLDAALCLRDGVRIQERTVYRDNSLALPRYEQDDSGEWVKGTGTRKGWYVFDLAPRLPHSIDKWVTQEDGSFGGVIQWWRQDDSGTFGNEPTIPAENLLRWAYDEEGSNWEGDPLIRSCWSRAMTRKRIQLLAEIAFNRHAGGVPQVKETVPNVLDDQDWSDLRDIARDYAQHQNMFLESPYGAEFGILEARMEFAKAMAEWWRMLGKSMCRATGCMHLYTGESNGTQALFGGQRDLFLFNASHLADYVCAPYNDLAEEWVQWNGFDPDLAPSVTYGDLVQTDMGKIAGDWRAARDAGVWHPTIEDERWLRREGGYPDGGEALTEAYEVQGAVEPDAPDIDAAKVVEVVASVVTGKIPKSSARAMLVEVFRLTEDAADAILADVEEPDPDIEPDPAAEPDPDPDDDDDDGTPPPPPGGDSPDSDLGAEGDSPDSEGDAGEPGGVAATRCCGGHVALADEAGARVPYKPGMTAAEYVEACGPMQALAEATFNAEASRATRDDMTNMVADSVTPKIRAIAEPFAEALAGADMAEAADLTLEVTDYQRDDLVDFLAEAYRAVREEGEAEVKGEVAQQQDDGDYPSKLAAALSAAGVAMAEGDGWDDIDSEQLDMWEQAAARTTADKLLQDVQQAARKRHQDASMSGGTSATALLDGAMADLAPEATVRGDVNGSHAGGRAKQLAASDVMWGIYTLTPELGGKDGGGHTPCIACQYTASDPRNPFKVSDPADVDWFAVPSPRCYGGSTCYCTIIGLTVPPTGGTP